MSETGIYTFSKQERLHHRSLVEGLFRTGKSFYEFPFRVTWKTLSTAELQKNFRNRIPEKVGKVQMMVTVPKKKRKKAVDRVLIRRRIREAYRINKNGLKSSVEEKSEIGTLSLALVYIHDQNLPYEIIANKIKAIIAKLQTRLAIQKK